MSKDILFDAPAREALKRGVGFIRALAALDDVAVENEDQKIGVGIIRTALRSPLHQIAENAGIEGSTVVQRVLEGSGDFGFNARTDSCGALLDEGVLAPTKVVPSALENTASIAGLLLTTETIVVEHGEASTDTRGGMGEYGF